MSDIVDRLRDYDSCNESDIDAAADLIEAMRSVLRKCEWSSGSFVGTGSVGPFTTGGFHVPTCPVCGGINPDARGASCFIKEAHGHRYDCPFSILNDGAKLA